jgi:hypothetical protein
MNRLAQRHLQTGMGVPQYENDVGGEVTAAEQPTGPDYCRFS